MNVTVTGTADLKALAAELDAAARIAPAETRKVVAKGALNIKKDWQDRWSGLKHAPALPSAITYDSHETPTGGWAEIGPDKAKRQGALGNLIEYGSVKNPPRPGGAPALEAERPKFEKALEVVAVQSLGFLR